MKDGCAPEGSCGACTVLVDGRAVVSCAQKATRASRARASSRRRASRRDEAALGGRLRRRRRLAVRLLLAGDRDEGGGAPRRRIPTRARDEIAHALLGNLCRCTGYVKIIDAVQLAAGARRGEPLPQPGRRRGRRTRARATARTSSPSATSRSSPTSIEPGMLHGALRFSDHPRARVLRIDTSKAEAHPGVVDVVTAADVPGRAHARVAQAGLAPARRRGRDDVVRRRRARRAWPPRRATPRARPRRSVEVEYEVLEPVTDPFDALAADAPLLHEGGNVLSTSTVKRGDVDTALAGAAHVVDARPSGRSSSSTRSSSPRRRSRCPSTTARLHVYSQGQGVWDDRRQIAQFLGVPEEQRARHAGVRAAAPSAPRRT